MRSELQVRSVGGRSVVTQARSEQPLRLLTPRGGGHAAWVYQSSLGGGFVGHDDLALSVHVDPGASLFLTSQASSKVYRGAQARFELDARVERDAALVAWPDPVACFAGASLSQQLRFSLHETSRLLCVDAYTAGRVEHGERWAFTRLELGLSLEIAGRSVLGEGLLLDPAHGALPQRLAGFEAFATVVLVGVERELAPVPEVLCAASRWPWGTVLRLAAPSVEALTGRLRSLLRSQMDALLGDDPFARKW